MGFRLFACGLLVAVVALFAVPAEPGSTPVPSLTTAELQCQRATAASASAYLRRAFVARQACFEKATSSDTPPTLNCRAPVDDGTGDESTDNAISAAEALLAMDIQTECLDVELTRLGFPGQCEDTFGPPYDTFDHEQCLIDKANAVIDKLLDIEHPAWPGPNLPNEDLNCQATIASGSSSMFFKEVRRRTVECEQRRLEGKIPADTNCRAEIDPLAPDTGNKQVDTDIVEAHTDVLRGIADNCPRANLSRLGFPHKCTNATGLFSVAALTECMYITHHFPLIDFVDTIDPLTKMCGNCIIDGENGEKCDDGDNKWAPGEICRTNCSQVTLCGDPDDSGSVTIRDALFILRAAVGLEACHTSLCDVSGDGFINTSDALRTLRFAVGLQTDFLCNAAPPADLVCPVP
jgi:hypothetical protein